MKPNQQEVLQLITAMAQTGHSKERAFSTLKKSVRDISSHELHRKINFAYNRVLRRAVR